MPPTDVILGLQELLLKAVLLGQLLPGQSEPVQLPDLSFLLRGSAVYLADDNLAGKINIAAFNLETAGIPVRMMPTDALEIQARRQGDVSYLRFQPPDVSEDLVQLTLEARMAYQDPHKKSLGLSSVIVKFSRGAHDWQVREPPLYLAL